MCPSQCEQRSADLGVQRMASVGVQMYAADHVTSSKGGWGGWDLTGPP